MVVMVALMVKQLIAINRDTMQHRLQKEIDALISAQQGASEHQVIANRLQPRDGLLRALPQTVLAVQDLVQVTYVLVTLTLTDVLLLEVLVAAVRLAQAAAVVVVSVVVADAVVRCSRGQRSGIGDQEEKHFPQL